MSIFTKINSILKREREVDDSSFKIKKSQAFNIADLDENLKSDYYKNTKREGNITLLFNDNRVKLINLDGRKYWCVQILDADVNGITYVSEEEEDENRFSTEDMKILRCLIDVETGEYVYYPYEIVA